MRFLKFILTITLFTSAFFGDYIVFKSKLSNSQVFRAIGDSAVHATIGFLSSALFFTHKLNVSTSTCVYNMIFCTIISSVIDIDHVFVAKSLHLKDLTNLKQRGIFHCTTFWLLITTILLTYSFITKNTDIYIVTFMFILAFTSHHVRDGNRRGLWMFPFGHTNPIPRYMYVLLLGMLPHIFSFLYVYLRGNFRDVDIEYIVV